MNSHSHSQSLCHPSGAGVSKEENRREKWSEDIKLEEKLEERTGVFRVEEASTQVSLALSTHNKHLLN